MSDHDLHAFISQITSEMASEYSRIYENSVQDPGTAGDEGEENWAKVLRDWLPPSYQVMTKGRLIGHDGRMSPQIDIVVLKPSYPRKLLEKRVWLADGVAAAFECKNTITAAHVRDSIRRCQIFKSIVAKEFGNPRKELTSKLSYGILAHSHSWKGQRSTPVENITKIIECENIRVDHPRDLLDFICVADLASWSYSYMSDFRSYMNTENQSVLEQIFGGSWGVVSTTMCAAYTSQQQEAHFHPIGSFIGRLTQRLAWNDPSIRDIADYYRLVSLWGAGAGTMKFWPQSVYSNETRNLVDQNYFGPGGFWNDWIRVVM